MKKSDLEPVRSKILALLSREKEGTYRKINALHDVPGEVYAATLGLYREGLILFDSASGWYTQPPLYEWHGANVKPGRVPYRGTARPCHAGHTAGFLCNRARGHWGRHMAHGTEVVLAVWVPGGRFDPDYAFTDAERRALDIDAAQAF